MSGIGTATLPNQWANGSARHVPALRRSMIRVVPTGHPGAHEATRPTAQHRPGHPLVRKFWAVTLRFYRSGRPQRLPLPYL